MQVAAGLVTVANFWSFSPLAEKNMGLPGAAQELKHFLVDMKSTMTAGITLLTLFYFIPCRKTVCGTGLKGNSLLGLS